LKHLYLVCHIGGFNLPHRMYLICIMSYPLREQLLGGSLCGAQIP
jgi:hypothetical protein